MRVMDEPPAQHLPYAERYAATKAAVDGHDCPLCGAKSGELCFAEGADGEVIRAIDTTHVARLRVGPHE
ncbi:MAG: hypothetical protein QOJ62_2813 [Actinomycetota bacterium]|jgi:hypothetical protein|nr:hypothetical protein [Actinomycetota bacterium]